MRLPDGATVTVTELLDLLIKKSIFPLLFIYNIYIEKT